MLLLRVKNPIFEQVPITNLKTNIDYSKLIKKDFINLISHWESMIVRSNKIYADIVIKALEMSLKGDDFGAVNLMREHGLPNKVIARVLHNKDQMRSSDIKMIRVNH